MKRTALFLALWMSPALAEPPVAQVDASSPVAYNENSIRIGVGAILWREDLTDTAFDLTRYFERRPLMIHGSRAHVFLVDYATDSDWYVTGEIQGSSELNGNGWGSDDNVNASVSAKLVLKYRGKKVADIFVGPQTVKRQIKEQGVSRRELLDPLWKLVAAELVSRVGAAR